MSNILQNTSMIKSNNKISNKRVREEDYQEEQDFFASFFDVLHPPKQAKVKSSIVISHQSEQDSLTPSAIPSTTQQQVLNIFDDIDFSSLNSFLNDSSDDSDFFNTTITAMDNDKTQIENLRQYLEFL